MTTVSLELPDNAIRQLNELAASRGISIAELIADLGSAAFTGQEQHGRFRVFAAKGNRTSALAVLDRLDRADGTAH